MTPEQIEKALDDAFRAWGQKNPVRAGNPGLPVARHGNQLPLCASRPQGASFRGVMG